MIAIDERHWLTGPEIRHRPLPGGASMPIRRALVIHFTSGASAASSIEFWQTPAAKGACAHLIIDRDGTIYQCRPFDRTAGHAGVSQWADPSTRSTTRHRPANHPASNHADPVKWKPYTPFYRFKPCKI